MDKSKVKEQNAKRQSKIQKEDKKYNHFTF